MNEFKISGKLIRLKVGEGKNGPYAFGTVQSGEPGSKEEARMDFSCFDHNAVASIQATGEGGQVALAGAVGGAWKVELKVSQADGGGARAPVDTSGFDEVPF